MKQEFDLEQLKRDGGNCLYENEPAYAHLMQSGTLVYEYVGKLRGPLGPWTVSQSDPDWTIIIQRFRNLPKKKLVQWWRRTDSDGYVGEFLGVDMDHTPGDGWIKVAEKEIYEGDAL